MHKHILVIIILILFAFSCKEKPVQVKAAFSVYCEMVANDAKPLALHYPMPPEDIDNYWNSFELIASDQDVKIYREDTFPTSLLFPEDATSGKTVVLIYKDDRLVQYQQWKSDVELENRANREQQMLLARRFGRLLGYSSSGINDLLRKNSNYFNIAQANVATQITHLYYNDLEEASIFYKEKIGLKEVDSLEFKISEHAFIKLHSRNVLHPESQPNSTAIALLTDQLPAWYARVKNVGIPIKYTYKPKDGGPHDGFVAIDPGGYLLEFEEFKQHPENELFMATLENAPKIETKIGLSFYGSITWTYHQDLLQMQNFYEEVIGYRLVADQGWTKIYQTSPTGFIGLVDERRGMEDYADDKAVEIEWRLKEFKPFDSFALEHWQHLSYNNGSFKGPEKYIYRVKDE